MEVQMPEMVATGMKEFTGRVWVLPKLLEWLEHTEQRTFIFTGIPGTGKSSLIAWLSSTATTEDDEGNLELKRVRSFVKAVHFCMANTLNAVSKALAQSLADQLARNVQGFAQALTASLADVANISAEVYVEKAETGANVMGVKLDLGRVSEMASFSRVICEPLGRLYEGGYAAPILIVVDALDESSDLGKEAGIVSILSKLDNLPEQVRFLMTTRPDRRVLKHFPSAQVVDLISDKPPQTDDLRDYAYKRLAPLDSGQRPQLADRIRDEAKGNFLYARLVIDNLLPRLGDLTDLTTISFPKGLSGIYSDFMNRELGLDEDLWFETYEPLLGLIAVARGDGIRREQLEAIVGKELLKELRQCQQYLSGNLPDGPFRPFHKSFADYLLEDPENIDYKINPANMHRRVRNFYRGDAATWEKVDWGTVDDYGLLYLASHLYALRGEKGYRHDLYDYLCGPLITKKLERYGSPQLLAADTSLAIKAARSETPRNLVQEVRAYFIYSKLGRMAAMLTSELLGALAAVGKVEKAKGYAPLIQNREKQCEAYCLIGEALVSHGMYEEARTLLDHALAAADKIDTSISSINHLKALWDVLSVMSAAADKEGLERIAAAVEEDYNLTERAQVFGRLAVAFARMNEPDRAAGMARSARSAVELIDAASVSYSLGDVASSLAEVGDEAGVELVISKARVAGRDRRALMHAAVRALFTLGQKERALALADKLFESALKISDRAYRAGALKWVARAFIHVDDKEKARDATENALTAAREITNPSTSASMLGDLVEVLLELNQAHLVKRAAEDALRIVRQSALTENLTIAAGLRILGELEAREELADLFDHPSITDEYCFIELAFGLAKTGELESALKVSNAIQNVDLKSMALGKVVMVLIHLGNYERAFEVTKGIENSETRIRVLSRMTVELNGRGQDQLAADAVEQVLAEVKKAPKDVAVKGHALGQMALAFMNVQQETRAAVVAERVFEELMNPHPNSFPHKKLLEPVQALIQVREFDKALKLAGMSDSSELHSHVAEALAGAGEVELARSTAMQVVEWATAKGNISWTQEIEARELSAASLALAATGELPRAKDLALRAFRLASMVAHESSKSYVLAEVSQTLSRAGEKEYALSAARQAFVTALNEWKKYAKPKSSLFGLTARADAVEALVMAGDVQAANMAARDLLEDAAGYVDLSLILATVRANVAVGNIEALERVSELAANLNEQVRGKAMSGLAQHFSKAGRMKQALDCVLYALEFVPTTTAPLMWEALGSGADALAAVDAGETLWRIYEEIVKVDDWF